jgi:hypothetical protein
MAKESVRSREYRTGEQLCVSPSIADCNSSSEANEVAVRHPSSWRRMRYNRVDPNEIRFNTDSSLWHWPYVLSGFGAFFMIFGGLFLWLQHLTGNRPAPKRQTACAHRARKDVHWNSS